jgi:hypothetical protein
MEFRCSIQQLIRLSLAVGLLAAGLAPSPAQAQGPPGSQGLWQTFTTANSGLGSYYVTALLEDQAGGLWVGPHGDGVSYHWPGSYRPWVLLHQLEVEQKGKTDVERRMLHALIEGKPVPADVDPAFLHGLTQLGYLRREGDSYAIGNAFFARWLRQSAPWREKSRVSDEGTLNLYKVGVLRQERIASLRQQREIHIKNLNRLEERAARHGMDVLTSLRNEMDCEREAIARIEAELEQMGGET